MFYFERPDQSPARLRLALYGAAGSGKTWTALAMAQALGARELGPRVALVDTEGGAAAKYADRFAFDMVTLSDRFSPGLVPELVRSAQEGGYDTLILDNFGAFWTGPGGLFACMEQEVQRSRHNVHVDSFTVWQSVDAKCRKMVQAIRRAPMHVIVTLRARVEFDTLSAPEAQAPQEGRLRLRKLGVPPTIRNSFHHEMDMEAALDGSHGLHICRSRCPGLEGQVVARPSTEPAGALARWIRGGGIPAEAWERTEHRTAA